MAKRPTKTRKKRSKLTGRQIEHLLWGWSLAGGRAEPDHGPFQDDDARRRAWFENRDFLISLEGERAVPGVFGLFPLPEGEKPQASEDYE